MSILVESFENIVKLWSNFAQHFSLYYNATFRLLDYIRVEFKDLYIVLDIKIQFVLNVTIIRFLIIDKTKQCLCISSRSPFQFGIFKVLGSILLNKLFENIRFRISIGT